MLLERVQRWDEAALAEVYDTYAPAIYRYACRHLGNSDSAQEIVADTFHRFLVALKQGAGPQQELSAWLYRVAHNLITDYYRRESIRGAVEIDENMPSRAPQTEAAALQREEITRIRQAFQHLPSLQQQVINLRFGEGLSLEEVAQVTEKTVGAVKALQHRAIEALRTMLDEKQTT
ncbi:MAG: ECF RNA polymerase sigma factor SigW [Chloroflexi bacterium ADurb.Bin360]|nr:MAG: ECF RNA polymerase sigma factor SigW [Chloroflexi bacterium ADurb.Bin360]